MFEIAFASKVYVNRKVSGFVSQKCTVWKQQVSNYRVLDYVFEEYRVFKLSFQQIMFTNGGVKLSLST